MLTWRYHEVIRKKLELSLTLSKESQHCLVNAGTRTYRIVIEGVPLLLADINRSIYRTCGKIGELFLADWSSCFKLAMSFFASTSLFSSVFMASHFVRTRLASSSASFATSWYSFSFSSNCCPRSCVSFSWFRKACPSLSWSFSKLSYRFCSSLLLRSESVSRASAFRWRLFGLDWRLTVSHSHWR